jgi:hypothetical protein
MWLPNTIIDQVEELARVHYVDKLECQRWNEHRQPGELRLLTGWCWTAKRGTEYRQGFKTRTVAIRDCYYAIALQQRAPISKRSRIRLVA